MTAGTKVTVYVRRSIANHCFEYAAHAAVIVNLTKLGARVRFENGGHIAVIKAANIVARA